MATDPVIVVPLYIYPSTPDTWRPLHEAISAYASLHFIIILNPNSGPGESSWFSASHYVDEIPRLAAYANVTLLGYCRIDYCRRSVAEVTRDVEIYAGWAKVYRGRGVEVGGIFFDETPNRYDEAKAEYLRRISWVVKSAEGIGGGRMVIHNPGTLPDPKFATITAPLSGPDITVIFEESYAHYHSPSFQHEVIKLHAYDRSKCCFIMHSVPQDYVRRTVRELRHRSKILFVTELSERYYERFEEGWKLFVQAMGEQ